MKILPVSLIVCALVVLTSADFCTIDGTFNNCPRGWKEFHGRCFFFVATELTWAKAETNCLSMNANLASIHSDNEEDFLQDYLEEVVTTIPGTWIGASDCLSEGNWLWTDGKAFSNTDWCSNQPNNDDTNGQHCVAITTSGTCWNDIVCSSTKASLCVKSI